MTLNEKENFTGKVAFVTGAASGIGRAAALAFARQGASVVVADVSEPGNQETARLIEERGGRALAVRCDVTRAEDVKAALDKTAEVFGRLDVAFNNAGVEPKTLVPTAEVEEEEWDRIINIDLRGVFLCMKYEIPLMLKHGGGAIVLYVRAYHGRQSRWYQAAARQRAGRILAAGMTKDVTFELIDGPINDRIDAAYRAKYQASPYLRPMVSAGARSATVKVIPKRESL